MFKVMLSYLAVSTIIAIFIVSIFISITISVSNFLVLALFFCVGVIALTIVIIILGIAIGDDPPKEFSYTIITLLDDDKYDKSIEGHLSATSKYEAKKALYAQFPKMVLIKLEETTNK